MKAQSLGVSIAVALFCSTAVVSADPRQAHMMEEGLLPPPNEVLGVEFKDAPPKEEVTVATATRGVHDQQQPEDGVMDEPEMEEEEEEPTMFEAAGEMDVEEEEEEEEEPTMFEAAGEMDVEEEEEEDEPKQYVGGDWTGHDYEEPKNKQGEKVEHVESSQQGVKHEHEDAIQDEDQDNQVLSDSSEEELLMDLNNQGNLDDIQAASAAPSGSNVMSSAASSVSMSSFGSANNREAAAATTTATSNHPSSQATSASASHHSNTQSASDASFASPLHAITALAILLIGTTLSSFV